VRAGRDDAVRGLGGEAGGDGFAVPADDQGGGGPALVAVGGDVVVGAADTQQVVVAVAVEVGELDGAEISEAGGDVLTVPADERATRRVPALVAVGGQVVVGAADADQVPQTVTVDVGELRLLDGDVRAAAAPRSPPVQDMRSAVRQNRRADHACWIATASCAINRCQRWVTHTPVHTAGNTCLQHDGRAPSDNDNGWSVTNTGSGPVDIRTSFA